MGNLKCCSTPAADNKGDSLGWSGRCEKAGRVETTSGSWAGWPGKAARDWCEGKNPFVFLSISKARASSGLLGAPALFPDMPAAAIAAIAAIEIGGDPNAEKGSRDPSKP